MHEDHFGPEVAAGYDDDSAAMFAPKALAPVLDRLEGLAAADRRSSSPSAPGGSDSHSPHAGFP